MERSWTPAHLIASILLILFGCLYLFGGICGPLMFLGIAQLPQPGGAANPVAVMLAELPWFWTMGAIAVVFSLVSGSIHLVSGVYLLRWRPWARRLAISWMMFMAMYTVVMSVVTMLWINPLHREWIARWNANHPTQPLNTMDPNITAIVSLVFNLGLNALIVVLLTLPSVTESFQRVDGPLDVEPVP